MEQLALQVAVFPSHWSGERWIIRNEKLYLPNIENGGHVREMLYSGSTSECAGEHYGGVRYAAVLAFSAHEPSNCSGPDAIAGVLFNSRGQAKALCEYFLKSKRLGVTTSAHAVTKSRSTFSAASFEL